MAKLNCLYVSHLSLLPYGSGSHLAKHTELHGDPAPAFTMHNGSLQTDITTQ